jgi:hypothetical protein
MRKFIFLIGSTDDFDSLESLKTAYFELGEHVRDESNASFFEVEVPENLDRGHAFLIGCGLAFTNDWCMDGTFSTLLEA